MKIKKIKGCCCIKDADVSEIEDALEYVLEVRWAYYVMFVVTIISEIIIIVVE